MLLQLLLSLKSYKLLSLACGDDLGLEHGSLYFSNVFVTTFGFGLDVQCRNLLGSQIKLRSCCHMFPNTLANKSESLFPWKLLLDWMKREGELPHLHSLVNPVEGGSLCRTEGGMDVRGYSRKLAITSGVLESLC